MAEEDAGMGIKQPREKEKKNAWMGRCVRNME
jgi:hypothetical protein